MGDFDNVVIDDNIHEDLTMTIEGPNTRRTLFFSLSFLFFLLTIFIFYLFLPNSKYTQTITINAGETRKIDVTNAYRGNFQLNLYSIKSQTNLNPNKLYFGQFKINLSVKYFFDSKENKEILTNNNILIEPTFELDQKISFPITIYEDDLPRHIDSLSIIISSERISINKFVLEFVFDNSIHFSINLTWKIFGSIISCALLIQYLRIIFCNNKKISRLEQKLILIYLVILGLGNYPFCFIFIYFPYLQKVQKSLSNSFFLCLILILLKSVKLRGKKFSILPYILISLIFTIADLIDTKYSFHHIDAIIGIFYLTLYIYEIIGAFANHDETERFKLQIYSSIFVFIPLLLFLSRILTKWYEIFNGKNLNLIFSDIAHIIFAFLLSYLFYPIDPIDEVEYSKIHK